MLTPPCPVSLNLPSGRHLRPTSGTNNDHEDPSHTDSSVSGTDALAEPVTPLVEAALDRYRDPLSRVEAHLSGHR